jgi:hypothetical protein
VHRIRQGEGLGKAVAVKAAVVQNMARHVLRNALVLWLSGQGNRHSVLRSCTGTPSRIFIESGNKKMSAFLEQRMQ